MALLLMGWQCSQHFKIYAYSAYCQLKWQYRGLTYVRSISYQESVRFLRGAKKLI